MSEENKNRCPKCDVGKLRSLRFRATESNGRRWNTIPAKICQLCKHMTRTRRTIQKTIRPRNTRGPTINEIEELFVQVKDISQKITKLTDRILDKVKIAPEIHQKILNGQNLTQEESEQYALCIEKQKLVVQAFGNLSELRKYLNSLHDLSAELEVVEEDFDDRLKLDDYKRVIIKMYDLVYRYRAIGKKFHKSAKWIKQIVEDPELEKIIEQVDGCPSCGFEWAPFFKKQAKRIEKGLEPTLPSNFKVDWKT